MIFPTERGKGIHIGRKHKDKHRKNEIQIECVPCQWTSSPEHDLEKPNQEKDIEDLKRKINKKTATQMLYLWFSIY